MFLVEFYYKQNEKFQKYNTS